MSILAIPLILGLQIGSSGRDVSGLVAISLLCVAALVGTVIAARIWSKRLRQGRTAEGFTLDDLRRMQARGEINAVEFEALKQAMIAGLRSNTPKGDARPRE